MAFSSLSTVIINEVRPPKEAICKELFLIEMASGSASCGTNYFCVGAFLIFVGSVLLCALGFTVLLPHVATRKWPEVTCEVMNTSYNFMQCMCDQQIYAEDLGCVIKYPCLEVMIRYNVSRSALRNTTGLSMAKYELLDRDATQTFHYTDKHVTNRTHSHLSEGLPQELPREKFGVEHKQPEANTIDKLEEGSVSNPDAPKTEVDSSVGNPDASKTEVDSSRGHVDPRSTLPYSGSAMTSDANLATAKMENGARDDVVWVSTTLFRWWSDAFYGKVY